MPVWQHGLVCCVNSDPSENISWYEKANNVGTQSGVTA